MTRPLTIGSRASKLALTQSNHVADLMRAAAPGIDVSIQTFSTKGDRVLDAPLAEIGGKGLFTEELEAALRSGDIDLAVHSMKDLPTELAHGLAIGAVPPRENPHDALVCDRHDTLDALPNGARVGTSSLRRKAQLLAYRPDFVIVDIRGNVQTRVRKVREGVVDAAILACAGLERLGLHDAIAQELPPDLMVPAPAQGALGIEIRDDDTELRDLLETCGDPRATAEVAAERTVLAVLEGGCQVPLGALARIADDTLSLAACVCDPDGRTVLRAEAQGPPDDADALGRGVADDLLRQGADRIIAAIR